MQTYEEFIKEYNDMFLENEDIDEAFLYPDKRLFEESDIAHDNIRQVLGGSFVESAVTLKIDENNINILLDKEKTNKLYIIYEMLWRRNGMHPGFYGTSLAKPYLNISQNRQVKTSRYVHKVSAALLKKGILSQADYDYVNRTISELGKQLWLTKSCELNVRISTKLVDFMKLGYYQCDEGSCFRNCGEHEHDKYILAQTDDTFVLTASTDKECVFRCWGFMGNADNWYMCNRYQTINESELYAIILEFFKKQFGKNFYKYGEKVSVANTLYQNDGGTFTISSSQEEPERIYPNLNISHVCDVCDGCNSTFNFEDEYIQDYNGQLICDACRENTFECYECDCVIFDSPSICYRQSSYGQEEVYLCDSCFEEYERCEDCGNKVSELKTDTLCAKCAGEEANV